MIDELSSRADLEAAILLEPELYATFDEQKLLNDGYSDDELLAGIRAWIEAGDECKLHPQTDDYNKVAGGEIVL